MLTGAGHRVIVPPEVACCGLTWISTGQLDGARRQLARLLDVLAPHADRGTPIVGLEPSSLAEQLRDAQRQGRFSPPDLSGVDVVAQPHCHQHAVLSYDADLALLRDAGASPTVLAGCCGLAGNFGMERGHYETSVAVAASALLPALGERGDAVFLADGFSCRTQAEQLAGVRGVHLAQLLAARR